MKKQIFRFCLYLSLTIPFACTYDKIEVMEVCDTDLVLTVTDQTASACGIASGSFVATVEGSVAVVPLEYSLNGTDFQTSPGFTDLAAGSYTLTARQGACITSLNVTLENSEGLNATALAMASDCGATNGKIVVTTSNASGAVSFSLNGGSPQSSATFSGLAPGAYQVAVADEIGCQVTLEASITSTVTFAEVRAIVTLSCAVSGCHAGNISPDLRVATNIVDQSVRIASRTGSMTMPPASSGRSLAQAEIDAIACWVADGAPE